MVEYTMPIGGINFFAAEPNVSSVIIRTSVLQQAGVILPGPYSSDDEGILDEKLYFPIEEYEKLKKLYPKLQQMIDQEQKRFRDIRGPRHPR